MVEIIGLVTISVLVWLLAWSMAGESDSERRKIASIEKMLRSSSTTADAAPFRHAA